MKPITDTDRMNWLESHPLSAEVRGGNDDGHTGKAWAIAAHSGTLREAVDVMIFHEGLITVCDKCFCASCWQGIFLCQESKNAGVIQKTRKELSSMSKESPSFWKTDQELSEE